MSSGRYWVFIADKDAVEMYNTGSGDILSTDGNHEDVSTTLSFNVDTVEFDAYKSWPRKVGMPKNVTLTDTDNHKMSLEKYWNIDIAETSGPV